MHLLTTEFVHPEMTLHCLQNVKSKLLAVSVLSFLVSIKESCDSAIKGDSSSAIKGDSSLYHNLIPPRFCFVVFFVCVDVSFGLSW